MYSVFTKTPLTISLVLLLAGMVFPAALAEALPQPELIAQAEVENVKPIVQPEAAATVEPAEGPGASATANAAIETEEMMAAVPEATVIPENLIPLAGKPEPSVTVRANRDISSLRIGDRLALTCELTGFDGMNCSIRWQALVNGSWKDLEGEHSETLTIEITDENADWAYRAAVDAQPVT